MGGLIKIREVSLKYDISARALKYYEDMGLLQSTKSDDYAYRLYDGSAIKRLEQILILRKLNIKIKDIQRIFNSGNSEIVLEVLSQKVTDIDDEVALLHELKEVVLEFIAQIEKADFSKDSDVKLFYEKVKEMERLVNVEYNGNPSTVNKLIDVTEKIERFPDIRIIELPKVKMARSGKSNLNQFDKWWSSIKLPGFLQLSPRDFMWKNEELDCFEWLFCIPDDFTDTNGFEIFDFPGGLYAVASAFDGEDILRVNKLIHKWVDNSLKFEVSNKENDTEIRYDMGHIIGEMATGDGESAPAMDLFIPIVTKNNRRGK